LKILKICIFCAPDSGVAGMAEQQGRREGL
jgi:hypothetical protein